VNEIKRNGEPNKNRIEGAAKQGGHVSAKLW
jgi:hypothetical protein